MPDITALTGAYETALAAHQDDPGDERKRAAADETATALQAAREAARLAEGRSSGMTATVTTGEEE
jgi:hypothetical protein